MFDLNSYEGAFHHPHFHRDQSDSETIAKYIYKKGTQVEEVPLSATTARRSKRKPSVNDTKPRPRATRTSPRATRGVEPMNKKNGTIPKHALLASKSNEPMSEENSSKDHSSTGGDSDPFPVLLYEIVSDLSKTNPDVINWLPSGDGFVVSKTSEEELGPFLLKYFNRK